MGPGHYHKMEPKPIAREPARPAGAGTILTSRSSLLGNSVRRPDSIRGWRRWRAPQDRGLITAQPLLFGRRGIRQDSLGGTRVAKGSDRYWADGLVPRRVGLPAARFRPRASTEQSREVRDR